MYLIIDAETKERKIEEEIPKETTIRNGTIYEVSTRYRYKGSIINKEIKLII